MRQKCSPKNLHFWNFGIGWYSQRSLRSTVGGALVFGRRTDPVLRSAWSRRRTGNHYVGKPSATG